MASDEFGHLIERVAARSSRLAWFLPPSLIPAGLLKHSPELKALK